MENIKLEINNQNMYFMYYMCDVICIICALCSYLKNTQFQQIYILHTFDFLVFIKKSEVSIKTQSTSVQLTYLHLVNKKEKQKQKITQKDIMLKINPIKFTISFFPSSKVFYNLYIKIIFKQKHFKKQFLITIKYNKISSIKTLQKIVFNYDKIQQNFQHQNISKNSFQLRQNIVKLPASKHFKKQFLITIKYSKISSIKTFQKIVFNYDKIVKQIHYTKITFYQKFQLNLRNKNLKK
eukprot:TRINITY_DN4287_c0_g2_i12.p1 TRINITY_DN4287_c0_g2~~TRINITY_DN4287_c0_g2_i12.p1  ORF type:complete len:238 (+),score=-17.49 TRINITY_DN4287_c0_g2_i12:290-1003(+)